LLFRLYCGLVTDLLATESPQLVMDLLRGNWSIGFWRLPLGK